MEKKITNKERENIKKRFRFYNIYIACLLLICIVLMVSVAISQIKRFNEAEKHLEFAKEIGEFIVFSAKLTNHCAEINNMTFEDITNSYLHKMVDEEIRLNTTKGGSE